MRLTILRNDAGVPAGHLERIAASRGIEAKLVKLDAGEPVPGLDSVEAVVALGGEMGAYETDRFPYLVEEKQLLAAAVAEGIPVLGVCLGGQLLAESLGGRAYLADIPEVWFGPLNIVSDDPVVGVFANRSAFCIHRDTWDVPPGATRLATSDKFEQAFRLGSALAVQPHPEIDPATVELWFGNPTFREMVELSGADVSEIRTALDASEEQIEHTSRLFFGAWLDEAQNIHSHRS
ncbi:MAG: type 1 glutamine amidotransferase [Acidimicrobiia bacterium]